MLLRAVGALVLAGCTSPVPAACLPEPTSDMRLEVREVFTPMNEHRMVDLQDLRYPSFHDATVTSWDGASLASGELLLRSAQGPVRRRATGLVECIDGDSWRPCAEPLDDIPETTTHVMALPSGGWVTCSTTPSGRTSRNLRCSLYTATFERVRDLDFPCPTYWGAMAFEDRMVFACRDRRNINVFFLDSVGAIVAQLHLPNIGPKFHGSYVLARDSVYAVGERCVQIRQDSSHVALTSSACSAGSVLVPQTDGTLAVWSEDMPTVVRMVGGPTETVISLARGPWTRAARLGGGLLLSEGSSPTHTLSRQSLSSCAVEAR
jgi:hypothetical protein